ncbi:MAG TPA: SPFH domain-containing protein [Rubrobacter sp.]|nr:SPFH domain-containing protein [Rubrobacter sp.]
MVPDGCRAVVTRFGKLEEVVEAGRKLLFNPWKQVSYIVNTTREYPYNAPIREAPTASRVNASVDLFLQFRIEDPAEFIFVARMLEEQETEAQRVRLESRDAWPRRPHRGGERGYGPPSPRPGPQG